MGASQILQLCGRLTWTWLFRLDYWS